MIIAYFVIVIAYAFIREKHVKKISENQDK